MIERTIGREKAVPYEVTDVEPAHRRDWDRVVAVFCSGKAWQFKTWPFRGAASGDLLDTFQRVLGVYLYFQDQTVEATGAWVGAEGRGLWARVGTGTRQELWLF